MTTRRNKDLSELYQWNVGRCPLCKLSRLGGGPADRSRCKCNHEITKDTATRALLSLPYEKRVKVMAQFCAQCGVIRPCWCSERE